MKKAKEEEARKKAAKKADKEKKRAAKKAADKGAVGVETVEKDGVQSDPNAGSAVEEVTEGVKQVALQTS